MTKFTITHEIRCNVADFWKTFLDKDFNIELYTKALAFPDYQIVAQTDDGAKVTRKVSAQPKMDVPATLQKLLGSGFRYTEEGSMTTSEGVWRWKMTPSTLADKLFMGGTVRAEPIGEAKTRRVAEISIEAKIFGVGGLIESTTEKQMREGWDKSAAFMNTVLARSKA